VPPTEIPFVVLCASVSKKLSFDNVEEVYRERSLLFANKLFLAHIPAWSLFEHFLFSPELVVWG